MRCMLTLVASSWLLACSSLLPVPEPVPVPAADAGPSSDAGANPEPCEGATESLAGRCLEGLGAGASCPLTPFSDDHIWLNGAQTIRYVAADGAGDGRSQSAPAGSVQAALVGAGDSVVLMLGAGTFELGDALPGQLTIIGRCAAESNVSLGVRGPLSRSAGQSLKLWGLAMQGDNLTGEQAIVEYTGAGELEAHQTVWTSAANALAVQGSVTLSHNTFGAIGAKGLGVRGPLSSVIVGDNHFLGPLGGEGVFLGPLGGEGVFRVTGNTFESIAGNALTIVDAASSVIVGDNHFLGPLGGEGVFVGPAQAMVTIENNRFESVAGHALSVQEITGGATLSGNIISASGPGAMGAGILILDARSGAVSVTNNQVNGATNAALVVERSSAQMNITGNTLSDTALPPEVGGDEQYAFGALVLDSGKISMTNNVIKNNPTAGVIYDLAGWNNYLRRSDLSGACVLENRDNEYAGNPFNEVAQNQPPDTERSSDEGAQSLPDRANPFPTGRRSGRASCGDGQTTGAEECDSEDPSNRSVCTADCRLIGEQPSASGGRFSCFLGSDYKVYCVASNQDTGILYPHDANASPPDDVALTPPTQISLGEHHFVGLAAGKDHACALTTFGRVLCWGDRSSGQVGHCDDGDDQTAPAFVRKANNQVLRDVRSIASHNHTTCAVTHDGSIYCWGLREHGQRLQGTPLKCAAEVGFNHPHQVVNVEVGQDFICTRSTEGQVACWGLNYGYQLGTLTNQICDDENNSVCSINPIVVEVPAVDSMVSSKASCGIATENNHLYCWGPKVNGSLPPTHGDVDQDRQGALPGEVTDVDRVSLYGLGHEHGCFVGSSNDNADDGLLKCWGHNSLLWLGAPNEGASYAPRAVPVTEDEANLSVELLSLGHRHTCTLRSDRKVRCWGMFKGFDGRDMAFPRAGDYHTLP